MRRDKEFERTDLTENIIDDLEMDWRAGYDGSSDQSEGNWV